MESDGKGLQADLDELVNWSNEWLLKFNPAKCKVMHVGHKVNIKYYMNRDAGTEIAAIQEEKDLGVYFTSDLKPSIQCKKAASKARRVIGMVRRNFRRLDRIPANLQDLHTSDRTWSTAYNHGRHTWVRTLMFWKGYRGQQQIWSRT